MFDIGFTGETADAEGEILHLGIMKLGEVEEGFAASLSFWSKDDYQKQWIEAARRLLQPATPSAFITDMYDPRTADYIQWWPVWRSDELVVFQQQILFISAKEGDHNYTSSASRFSVEDPYAAVMDWDSTHSEECRRTGVCRRPRLAKQLPDSSVDLCPSEWCVQLEGIQEFLERKTR